MTDQERAAMQQALECLKGVARGKYDGNAAGVCAALEAALAQQAEPLNLRDPAVQKRLATQWGYVPAAPAEPVQEPVAWNWMLDGLPYGRACYGDPPDADIAERAATAGRTVRLLYTSPPQRKPLTEEEIDNICRQAHGGADPQEWSRNFARAVERAVWEKNNG